MKTKHICNITVMDPDSKAPVELEIRKLESGGMIGIDASYLANTDNDVYDPYTFGGVLEIPNDEVVGQAEPFQVWIIWGEEATIRENCTTEEFAYATQDELNAFLEGIAACGSWDESLSWHQADTAAEAEEHVRKIREELAAEDQLAEEAGEQ